MNISKISVLNPKVWGVTVQFKVLDKKEPRNVTFNDAPHVVCEFKVGDDSGTIDFNVWDEQVKKFKVGKCYEVTEARLSVFNNSLKLNLSRKSEIKSLNSEIKVNLSNSMSEKFVEEPRQFKYKSLKQYNKF